MYVYKTFLIVYKAQILNKRENTMQKEKIHTIQKSVCEIWEIAIFLD